MPECTVCVHKERNRIDVLLVRQARSQRRIAAHYELTEAAIRRHRDKHLPKVLARAQAATELARSDQLLAELRDLHERARLMLEDAEAAGDLKTALTAVREARGCLELLAKLMGELKDAPTVNLILSPEWLELRAIILNGLARHPAAHHDMTTALEAYARH